MTDERNENITMTEMSEQELEEYLARYPSQIMEGLTLLGRQFPTESGRLDLLLCDDEGRVWVTELKAQVDDVQLTQGLDYYDYVRSNIETIARRFEEEGHEVDGTKEPGLMLVSTAFSSALMHAARYVNIPLELVEAIPVLVPANAKQALCRTIDYGVPHDPPAFPTRDMNLANIDNESVREVCGAILSNLESRGAEVRPLTGFWFSVRKAGSRLASIGCKKQFVSVYWPEGDGWSARVRVLTQDDWDQKVEPNLLWPA